MDPFLARTMVETLSKGLDPLRGGTLSQSDICNNSEMQEALETVLQFCSIESVEDFLKRQKDEKKAEQKARTKANKLANSRAGEPWSSQELSRAIDLNRTYNIWHIAKVLGRSAGGVQSKLEHEGIVPNKKRR